MLHIAIGGVKVDAEPEIMENIAQIVKLLCTAKANTNAKDKYGLTPIHYCAKSMNANAAKHLLNNEAKVNEFDGKKRTALEYIVRDRYPNVDFAKMLIEWKGMLGPATLSPLSKSLNQRQKEVRKAIRGVGKII